MPVLRQIRIAHRDKVAAEALPELAELQHGVLSAKQLQAAGMTRAAISRWASTGRLHRVHPHVYALGHAALSLNARLIAALLYGGDQAVLSHTTAAWVWQLIETEPSRIHVTVPGRCPSLPGVRIHHSRGTGRATCRQLPVTSVARTLIDIAAILPFRAFRRALAEADHRQLLDPAELMSVVGKGRVGSHALRAALKAHLPQLAETHSVLEERFVELCQTAGIPLPELNGRVRRMRVDAVWRDRHLAVELDGGPAHGHVAAMKRDRARELALRAHGFQVARYSWEQITETPERVIADLRQLLGI